MSGSWPCCRRRQRTDGKEQTAKNGRQRTDGKERTAKNRRQRTDGKEQTAKNRRDSGLKLALRMIRHEIGPWGLLILLFATTLAGNNNYHVWYSNIFIVCCYWFIVFQVVKTNRRLLIQMRNLPTFQQQFRKIAAAFSLAILFYLILIFALADATIDFKSVVYILQFFACSFAVIFSILDKSLKNLLLSLFIALSLFFEPSPLSLVAILVAFLPFSKLWSSTDSVKQMTSRNFRAT